LRHLAESGELTEEELVGAVTVLFRDGTHNTALMLGLSLFALLAERERWEAVVRQDPRRMEATVEELLRYLTAFQTISTRRALQDLELGSTRVRASDRVSVSLAAANRDPMRFEDPDRYDPERDATGQLAFGYGRHMCLGQHLVRLELQVGLAGLSDRFPDARLAASFEQVPIATQSVAWSVPQLIVELE
jgi:cytochrome P450